MAEILKHGLGHEPLSTITLKHLCLRSPVCTRKWRCNSSDRVNLETAKMYTTKYHNQCCEPEPLEP